MDIKGHTVQRVLVDQGADIEEEYYVSFLLDRANRSFLAMASYEGGMEIEQLAEERPGALARSRWTPPVRRRQGEGRARSSPRAKFPQAWPSRSSRLLVPLWETFVDTDATLVEVNPLARVADGSVLALDGKSDAWTTTPTSGSHANAEFFDPTASDPLEQQAKEKHLNYVKLDGRGRHHRQQRRSGVMSTLDVVAYAGEAYSWRWAGCQAGELPRTSAVARRPRSMANGLDDHPQRPGGPDRCSSTSSAGSPRATPWPTGSSRRWRSSETRRDQAAGRSPGRQQRRGGHAAS